MNTIENSKTTDIDTDQIDIRCFFNLMAINNSDEMINYINKLIESFKEYFSIISSQYNTLNEFYQIFSEDKKIKVLNNPLYLVESSLKELIIIQMKNLESMILKNDLITMIENRLIKFKELIDKLSSRFINFSKSSYNGIDYKQIANLSSSLSKAMNQMENKIIDQYISEKYNEHLSENENRNINDIVKEVKYLEKSLVDYINGKNVQYFNELKHSDYQIQNEFDKIKDFLIDHISYLKSINKNTNDELEKLENQIKSKKMKDVIKNDDNITFSESDFGLDEEEIFKNIYKINILKNNRIQLQNFENKEDEKIEKNEKNRNKIKSEKFKKNNRILDDKDIYAIISKLYNYDLLALDKTQYDIELEKGKLEAIDLSNDILKYNEEDEYSQKLLNENYDKIIKSIEEKILNNTKNIKSFFLILNNYRASGKTKFSEKFYELIIYIYTKVQDYCLNKTDKVIADLLLILSQTYYKEVNNQKVYILEGIKTHELYKKIDFWTEAIIKKIEEDIRTYKKISTKSEKNFERKEDNVHNKLIPYINLMNEFNFAKDKILEVVNKIFDKYNSSPKMREEILAFINKK